MMSVSDLLIPFFDRPGLHEDFVSKMAGCAIDAYGPESRADHINIARTVAFSMASVALLAKAVASQDMPLKDQLSVASRANALHRSAGESERSMMRRRQYDKANPSGERPDLWASASQAASEPERAASSPAEASTLQVRINDMLKVYHEALASEQPTSEPAPASIPQPSGAGRTPKRPQATAIHDAAPALQPETISLRQLLARSTAMPPLNGQAHATHAT